ncbi:ABC transporter [Trypanosoma theileri]|uniref:ABC transporter n=1 Tax=Trypanosoma theileri TaxID=67003 RepID=A0A1X0P3R6_9TRYP|nr:ABC transporter [Trypanosoma theileri]ORC91525.1 ABC transporter [Trypanosoma theileri]
MIPVRFGASMAPFRALVLFVAVILLYGVYQRVRSRREAQSQRRVPRRVGGVRRQPVVRFDRTLFRRLMGLLHICFPHVYSMESGLTLVLAILLMLRTKLTLKFAKLMGMNSKSLVQKDVKQFVFGVMDVVAYAIPSTVTSVGITYITSTLERRFRERLQNDLHRDYFKGHKVYDVVMNGSVDNPGHRLTNDVQRFCSELAGVLSAVVKPLIDIVVFSSALAKCGGRSSTTLMFSYYIFVAFLFRWLMPKFADMVAKSREKEGNLRMMHTQLIQHAEEVAFYRGAEVERGNANRMLNSFVHLERRIKRAKWFSSLLISILVKYGATCVGYTVCSLVVYRERNNLDAAALTELNVRSTQLYIPLSIAVGKLLSLHMKVSALCGSAHRVGELRDALAAFDRLSLDTNSNAVEVTDSNEIVFKDAAIVSPADQIIVTNFTTTFKPGNHVLLLGSNGSGKTALFRVLSGLWPLRGGSLQHPTDANMFFVTQRVYLPPGNLRTQLMYPALEKQEDPQTRELLDKKLLDLAEKVGLLSVVEREGGLDAEKEWSEVLSGGERQRVALVRAMYHQAMFLFLDECTSAISQDVELSLYKMLQRRGMTLITVSHREALKSLHHSIVNMDGMGGYSTYSIENSP